MEAPWVWDRPLTRVDAAVWISRADDIERLIELFGASQQPVFVWSPIKSGTTTFFQELLALPKTSLNSLLIDARQTVGEEMHEAQREGNVVIVDELDEFEALDDIRTKLTAVITALGERHKLILAGDNRVFKVAQDRLGPLSEFRLAPLQGNFQRQLVIGPFEALGYQITPEAAGFLWSSAAGNAYLIQRLAASFHQSAERSNKRNVGILEMQVFLTDSVHQPKDYFDSLADRILWDPDASYAIVDLLEARLPEDSPSLEGLGVVKAGERTFPSRMFESALRERCEPIKLARRFASRQNWAEAVDFYEAHLARFAERRQGREETLLEAVNACFSARDPLRAASFARQLTPIMEPSYRSDWLKHQFLDHIKELLLSLGVRDSARVFESVVQAADAIARTGRVRLYMTDADDARLMCRHAIGSNAEEFKKESVSKESPDWKVAKVLLTNKFAEVLDTQNDAECRRDVAQRLALHSSWLFPIPSASQSPADHGNSRPCAGVLCIDNPHHSPDRPTDAEKALICALLEGASTPLSTAKALADRSDLQFRLERLTSLHRFVLTDHPADDILDHLFEVATEIQPHLAIIVVRLRGGYHLNRLGIRGFYPQHLEPVFRRRELAQLNLDENFGDRYGIERHFQVYDVTAKTELDANPAMRRFLKALTEERVTQPIGSLLSFKLETADAEMGVCNFYTATPRTFLPDEIEALSMIVKQAAVALHNAEQMESVKRQRQGLAVLSDCISLVNVASLPSRGGVSPADVLAREVTARLGQLFHVSSASLSEMTAQKTLRIKHTWPAEQVIEGATREIGLDEGITGWAVQSGETKVLSVKDPEWRTRYIPRVPNVHTTAAFPMKDTEGNVIGALTLENEEEDPFAPQDIALIEAIVGQVPIAITNARLVARLTDAYEEIKQKHWAEAMGETVAAAVHRVGNLVAHIPAFSAEAISLIRTGTPDSLASAIEYVERSSKSAERMRRIAERLNGSGAGPRKNELIDIKSIVDQAIAEMERRLPLERIQCRVDAPREVAMYSDPDQVTEIVECLLENGLEASKHGTAYSDSKVLSVEVAITEASSLMSLEVTDFGNGIPHSLMHELCRTVVQSNWKGAGVGLFVSARHAAMLGGQLSFSNPESASSGRGATFRLQLPLSVAAQK